MTSILNHSDEFPELVGADQWICAAVAFVYKFLNTSQFVPMGDIDSIVQFTGDAECIVSCLFAFQTSGLAWVYISLSTAIWKLKVETSRSEFYYIHQSNELKLIN